MSQIKRLPLNRTSFDDLRQDNLIYVYKTDMIASIVNSLNVAFSLFRPRRFGKTLILNTLKNLLNQESFLRDALYKGFYTALRSANYKNFYKFEREAINSKGRADLSLTSYDNKRVVLELKLAQDENDAQSKLLDATEQIKTHDYGNNGVIPTTNIKRYALVFNKTDDVQKYDVLSQMI